LSRYNFAANIIREGDVVFDHNKVDYHAEDAFHLTFPDACFNVIISFATLECVDGGAPGLFFPQVEAGWTYYGLNREPGHGTV
jgi:hypothetical protein